MATDQEKAAVRTCLSKIDWPVIAELGAHRGEDEAWIRSCCRNRPHYLQVEPDIRNAQVILSESKWPFDDKHRIILGAVSDTNGFAEFHYCKNDRDKNGASGSLLKPTGHRKYFPWIEFPFTSLVPTWTLDAIFDKEWLSRIDLLWVDIQGAEAAMIRGGQYALQHTRYLFMEAETVELYEGEALKLDLIEMLPGWTLLEDFGCNIWLQNEHFSERGPR
jgi:FkbM family methyltransferase